MLSQYNGEKIRKAGNIVKLDFSRTNLSFSKYGLNKFKSFLDASELYLEDGEAMDKYAFLILKEVSDMFDSAALFFDMGNGTKIIYELYIDYDDEDLEPCISKYFVEDFTGEAFAKFDLESNYEMYGLLVYKENGIWQIIDR